MVIYRVRNNTYKKQQYLAFKSEIKTAPFRTLKPRPTSSRKFRQAVVTIEPQK